MPVGPPITTQSNAQNEDAGFCIVIKGLKTMRLGIGSCMADTADNRVGVEQRRLVGGAI